MPSPLLPAFPEMQSLPPEEQTRILEQCMTAPQYQAGLRLGKILGFAYFIFTAAAIVAFLMHRYLLVRYCVAGMVVFGFFRIFKKQRQLKLLHELVSQQLAAK